jgi:hypothetical protein
VLKQFKGSRVSKNIYQIYEKTQKKKGMHFDSMNLKNALKTNSTFYNFQYELDTLNIL